MTISFLLILLTALEGIIVFGQLFFLPSETANTGLFGFTTARLLMLSLILCGVMATLAAAVIYRCSRFSGLRQKIQRLLQKDGILFSLLVILYSVFFLFLQILFLVYSPVRSWDVSVQALSLRLTGLFVWGILSTVQITIFLKIRIVLQTRIHSLLNPFRILLLLILSNGLYGLLCSITGTSSWFYRIEHFEWFFFLPFQFLLAGWLLKPYLKNRKDFSKISAGYAFIIITLITFAIYRFTGQLMGRWNTPAKAYWHLLADAFWRGELYLTNPDTTHDLTLYLGHWFVPNPPLPALVLMPLVKIFGVWDFNMALFSAWIGALNSGLIYLILRVATRKGLIQTNQTANLWLTAVFAIGTNHWWLSILGQMWFVSQILTVTFSALAVLCVLYNKHPFVTGSMLGLAVLSRPNVFALFPLLLGIQRYQQTDFPKIRWRSFFRRVIFCGIPVLAASFLLLFYNHLRFEDWFDFGYVTINGADWIQTAVKEYGMFNLHFFKTNADVMLFRAPKIGITDGMLFFDPGVTGYSIFIMTPPVFYCFRRFKLNWWTCGALVSILISLGMLLTYHNTGAEQIGYRYSMDFILPLLLLIGQGAGKRTSILFKGLVIAAVIVNAVSIHWWFLGR
jgi:hypothetical protein